MRGDEDRAKPRRAQRHRHTMAWPSPRDYDAAAPMTIVSRIPYPLPQLAHFIRHRDEYGYRAGYAQAVKDQVRYFSRWYLASSRERYGRKEAALPPTTFIVLSYKRELNMRALVNGLLALRCAEKVIVVNNNPDIDLEKYLSKDPRLEIVRGTGAIGYRYTLAAELGRERYAFVDDDLFVMPEMWNRMIRFFDRTPDAPVGLLGALFVDTGDGLYHPSLPAIGVDFGGDAASYFVQVANEGVVDQLAALYVVSLAQVRRLVDLARQLGIDMANFSISDDIFLGHSGTSAPYLLGASPGNEWSFCLSASKKGVAISQSGSGYHEERAATFRQVHALAGIVEDARMLARRAEVVRRGDAAPPPKT